MIELIANSSNKVVITQRIPSDHYLEKCFYPATAVVLMNIWEATVTDNGLSAPKER